LNRGEASPQGFISPAFAGAGSGPLGKGGAFVGEDGRGVVQRAKVWLSKVKQRSRSDGT